jgi:hypothetical protein
MPSLKTAVGAGADWWSANAPQMAPADAPVVQPPSDYAGTVERGGIAGGLTTPTIRGPVAPTAGMARAAPATSAPAAPPTVQGPEAYGNDYQAWFNALIAGKPFNQQTLLELEPILNRYGLNLTPPNAVGERTKIQLPNGQWVRVGFGEGRPVWIPQSGAAGGGGQAGGGFQGWQGGETAGFGAPPPPYSSTPWQGGEYTAPVWGGQFTAPTMAQVEATPGYQTRLMAGQQALERSAAARGTLLGGGQQKALSRYGQEYGANEYGTAYNRALDEYRQKYGEFLGGAQLGQQQFQNRYGQYQDEEARKRTDYLQNYNVQRAAEGDLWGRYRDLYSGGLEAALGTRMPVPL